MALTNPVDFWKLTFKINFQDEPLENDFGSDYGYGEKYYLSSALDVGPATQVAQNILAARASLLGLDCQIVKAVLSVGSQVRSSYPIPNFSQNPVVMASDAAATAAASIPLREINAVVDSLLFRVQTDAGRRWTRQIRGIRDRWVIDQKSIPTQSLFGNGAGAINAYPAILPSPPVVGSSPAVFTVTNTNGVLSAPVIAAAGTYASAVNGIYPLVITDAAGIGNSATGHATIAGNIVTAVVLENGGTGYISPVLSLPVQNDANGLNNYQADATYLANFMAILGTQCINFHPKKVPNSSFPSGFQITQDVTVVPTNTVASPGTVCIERISSRQTGRIWVKRKARHKIAI